MGFQLSRYAQRPWTVLEVLSMHLSRRRRKARETKKVRGRKRKTGRAAEGSNRQGVTKDGGDEGEERRSRVVVGSKYDLPHRNLPSFIGNRLMKTKKNNVVRSSSSPSSRAPPSRRRRQQQQQQHPSKSDEKGAGETV